MANLSFSEKNTLEKLLEMNTGYVLNFSNNSFENFIRNSVNIDIYNSPGYEEYCSKANKLRQIWSDEPNAVVGKLILDLMSYFEDYKQEKISDYEFRKVQEMKDTAKRLLSNKLKVELPGAQEETLQTLLDDINNSLERNQPTLVLDRLHTFATKFLRKVCIDNGIKVVDNKGNYLPLHSLAGMLKKFYISIKAFQTDFTVTAIQNSISLFEKYNEIRNNQSYAHDNEILNNIEAEFAIKSMANVLTFIDKVENQRKEESKKEFNDLNLSS